MSDPNKSPNQDPNSPKNWAIGIGALILLFVVLQIFNPGVSDTPGGDPDNITFADVKRAVQDDSTVKTVQFGRDMWGNEIVTVKRSNQKDMVAGVPPGGSTELSQIALSKNIETDGTYKPPLKVAKPDGGDIFMVFLLNWGPILLLIGVWIYYMKKNGGMGGKKAEPKHQIVERGKVKQTFADFAGNPEAKEEVMDIVGFLKDPKALIDAGGRVPKGALMVGPPGNGKTLLARCIAGEAGVPFISISGSDFVEMYVGVGASRVRQLFESATQHAPCIVFIDEIDAVGRERGAGHGGGNDEREQTLNQILVELDGFNQKLGIFVIAATNRPDILDKALKRPGRLTRTINVESPDLEARKEILKVHAKGKTFGPDVDFAHVANETYGFSGADLEEVLDRATILMLKRVREAGARNEKLPMLINAADVEEATMEGSMKSVLAKTASRRQDPDIKRMLAYHEGGHGLVTEHGYQRYLASGRNWAQKWGNAVRRLTIIGAANTGGHMQATPDTNTPVSTYESLLGQIATALGATISEIMFTGTRSTGNSQDLKQAYAIAKAMVTKYGMSKLGPISVGEDDENPNAGRVLGMGASYGLANESSNQIDHEIMLLLASGARIAIKALRAREEFLHALVKVLVVKETIAREEWLTLWKQFADKEITDEQVEAELKTHWVQLFALSDEV
ncbi:MAG: AAA family ATPase [Candidatus Obscuribacter sp.]|nr:AAA family ATPase [Candidatus Obscuribacter sp.]